MGCQTKAFDDVFLSRLINIQSLPFLSYFLVFWWHLDITVFRYGCISFHTALKMLLQFLSWVISAHFWRTTFHLKMLFYCIIHFLTPAFLDFSLRVIKGKIRFMHRYWVSVENPLQSGENKNLLYRNNFKQK